MKIEDRKPYWFTEKGVKAVEEKKNAKYMGYWAGKTNMDTWGEKPLDVFYQAEPEEGFSNYFGLIVKDDKVLITDAQSCFQNPMIGIVEEDIVYVSRYRHDYVETPSGNIIDGGRDYVKSDVEPDSMITVTVEDGEFIFERKAELDEEEGYRHPARKQDNSGDGDDALDITE
tara:strand:+ start:1060 stop:1575 length:516 start_codon:yes stop_codon:yes gene_type:complete